MNQSRIRKRKTLKQLTIKDSFMFGAVMIDEENCRRALELTLELPIKKVTVSKEKSIVYNPGYKGVRLDVIADDESSTHYNIEMQVARKPAIGKRARYYHSQIDMELLQTGHDYELLPDAYVIFICDYDPFGAGLYRYTWDMVCDECDNLNLEDGSHTIFLSTHGTNDTDVPAPLVKFLKYIGAGLEDSEADFGDDFVRRLQASVADIKTSRTMEDRYMTWEELIKDERKEAKIEGKYEQLLAQVQKKLAKGKIPKVIAEEIEEDLKTTMQLIAEAAEMQQDNEDTGEE